MRWCLLAVMFALGCRDLSASEPAAASRLVVLLIIDQWPEWAFEVKRPHLHAGGFDRLLSEGSWHVGRHPGGVTLTAPGHALLTSGEPPARSGIVANEWWHRDLGRVLKSVETERGEVAATWLRVPGLGDAVAAAATGGRAVSVSLKERAAVLGLGHTGTAIWYEAPTVDWASSTHPSWLAAWNRARPVAFHLHDVWTPLDPDQLRALSGRHDYQIGEVGEKGLGTTFPHPLDRTKHPAEAILAAPIGNELVLDTALAAINGEALGADGVPDLLVISLSAHDYIAHGWGHESWEMWDATLRLDQQLARFLDELDRRVGTGRWSMVVTSDHGATHLPELTGAGRLRFTQIGGIANAAAVAVLGPGDWIADPKYPALYLSEAARAHPDCDAAMANIVAALNHMPGIAAAGLVRDAAGHCEARTGDARVLCLGLDPERSGDVYYQAAEGWLFETEDEPMAASHGSPHDYDRLVPVVMLPAGRTAHAPAAGPDGEIVPIEQISGIVAGWLGVTAPNRLVR